MPNGKTYRKQLKEWARRRAKIRARYAANKNLSGVAAYFGITKGRVWQIVNGK